MKHDEEFELDDTNENKINIQNILTISAVLIAAAGFIALSWYAYDSYSNNSKDPIPLIAADSSPRKISPSDPGGMQIPHMDKHVYKQLSKTKEKNGNTERILPKPEEPVSQDYIKQNYSKENINKEDNLVGEGQIDKNLQSDIDKAIEQSKIESSTDKNGAPALLNQELAANIEVKSPQEEKIIQNIPKGKKFKHIEYKSTLNNKNYKVQIASYKSENEAKKAWNFKSKNNFLKQYPHNIEKKNIANKGTMYRLQVGNFKDETQAVTLCKKLKSINIDCFIIRP